MSAHNKAMNEIKRLHEEIEFWNLYIEQRSQQQQHDLIPRAQKALAYAQRRLADLQTSIELQEKPYLH